MGLVYSFRSDKQQIELRRDASGLALFLDGIKQFDEVRWYQTNKSMTLVPSILCQKRERARVLGGGTGLSTRLLLEAGFARVDLFEFDAEVLRLSREHQAMLRVNANALASPRVHCHVVDVLSGDPRLGEKVDLAVNDAFIRLDDSNAQRLDIALREQYRSSEVYAETMSTAELADEGNPSPGDLVESTAQIIASSGLQKRVLAWKRDPEHPAVSLAICDAPPAERLRAFKQALPSHASLLMAESGSP